MNKVKIAYDYIDKTVEQFLNFYSNTNMLIYRTQLIESMAILANYYINSQNAIEKGIQLSYSLLEQYYDERKRINKKIFNFKKKYYNEILIQSTINTLLTLKLIKKKLTEENE